MQITRISPCPRRTQRVAVHLDTGETLELALEVVHGAGLATGDPLPPERRASLEAADLRWRAREAALTLLSHRARSAAEIRSRLRRKGFPEEVTVACVEALAERGLVDDGSFAGAFTRDRIRFRPKGARLIAQELRARGVDEETARDAIADALRELGEDERSLADRVAAKWKPRTDEDPRRAYSRLSGMLARRGFSAETVQAVAHARLGELGLA
jgi:regulatory protein